MANLPYVVAGSTLEKMLEKIKTASVPEKFSQDFVSTKLSLKGGTARSLIPFIKKMGLVTSDGTPTDRYREFRNPEKSGFAIAAAIRELYEELFAMNEYVYELDNNKLKGLIVEATGDVASSSAVTKTLTTFTSLKKLANFDSEVSRNSDDLNSKKIDSTPSITIPNFIQAAPNTAKSQQEGINLSYTINLNLPATTDIEVFNAIFQSLKQHLLQE
ncbi:DUF5343 domain-containing protein [Methylophilus sp. 5]|uniref:DUF5343 domain-containing protein n=1 Tax=Methylophilus sp. 5 TaxID=1112274 RepID=UPI00055F0ACD|nr:DUF5343 domain-containing protein [Methylophilus sp. 5]